MATQSFDQCMNLEEMTTSEVCDWLKKKSGKPFEESVLTALIG